QAPLHWLVVATEPGPPRGGASNLRGLVHGLKNSRDRRRTSPRAAPRRRGTDGQAGRHGDAASARQPADGAAARSASALSAITRASFDCSPTARAPAHL